MRQLARRVYGYFAISNFYAEIIVMNSVTVIIDVRFVSVACFAARAGEDDPVSASGDGRKVGLSSLAVTKLQKQCGELNSSEFD